MIRTVGRLPINSSPPRTGMQERCPPDTSISSTTIPTTVTPPTHDSLRRLEQHSASAPNTRRPSQSSLAGSVVRLPPARPATAAQRPTAAHSAPRPSTATSLRQRRDAAARTPPTAPRHLHPLYYASRRGPHSLGNGQISRALSHADLGSTPFGIPRWECPRPDLDQNTEKMLKKLFDTPPPTSPLRRFRSHQNLPPRWQSTQHKFNASFRAG